jgi:tripartite-type tricarboxylate transporter receptor subunit TctC
MRASLGQPFVIEIAAGANGSIGTGRAARAAGDGYTLVFGSKLLVLCFGVLKTGKPFDPAIAMGC